VPPLSNVIYTRIVEDQTGRDTADPGGRSGTTLRSSVTGPDLGRRLFGQATSRTRHHPPQPGLPGMSRHKGRQMSVFIAVEVVACRVIAVLVC
jgi:hypothetical protein